MWRTKTTGTSGTPSQRHSLLSYKFLSISILYSSAILVGNICLNFSPWCACSQVSLNTHLPSESVHFLLCEATFGCHGVTDDVCGWFDGVAVDQILVFECIQFDEAGRWDSVVVFPIPWVLFGEFCPQRNKQSVHRVVEASSQQVRASCRGSSSAPELLPPVSCQVCGFTRLLSSTSRSTFPWSSLCSSSALFIHLVRSLLSRSCILLRLPSFSSVPFTRCDIALIEQKHVERSDISGRIREKPGVCVTGSLCLEQGVCWEWM